MFLVGGVGNAVFVAAGYVIEVVDTGGHAKPVFFKDLALVNQVEGAAGRKGSQTL